jgi:tryptophan-rich sensory protein
MWMNEMRLLMAREMIKRDWVVDLARPLCSSPAFVFRLFWLFLFMWGVWSDDDGGWGPPTRTLFADE